MSNQLHNIKMLKILAEQELASVNNTVADLCEYHTKQLKLIEKEMEELQKMYQQSLIRIKELTEEANDARKDSEIYKGTNHE
tara:strand:+ start:123 stop:368 length:246 start_codon:yes stop_codon:yes gene_type:complete